MYISACKILKDPHLAEDAVHDAFVAISRNIDRLPEADSIKTASYVIKSARNTAINMLKKNRFVMTDFKIDLNVGSGEDALEEICSRENYAAIVSAIMSLEEKYRDVLSLYYLNELSVSEIADFLSRKENTVNQQLARGRKKLINNIEKELGNNEKKSYT